MRERRTMAGATCAAAIAVFSDCISRATSAMTFVTIRVIISLHERACAHPSEYCEAGIIFPLTVPCVLPVFRRIKSGITCPRRSVHRSNERVARNLKGKVASQKIISPVEPRDREILCLALFAPILTDSSSDSCISDQRLPFLRFFFHI